MYQLRDYQLETINNIYKSMANHHKSIMVQQPPRTGKTVIMAEIARRATAKGNRVLFVVHRREIVKQVKQTFINQSVDMSLAMVGMVQTVAIRLHHIPTPKVLFVDEAHHSLAKSYQRILKHFPDAIKLLFTATPYRMSGEGFEAVADDLIVGKPISWLIENNFLAPVDYYAPTEINTEKLKIKRTGEFDSKSIEEAFKPKIYGNAVKTFQKLANNKQAIAYTYNVASAEHLAKEFNANGITAQAVNGKTPIEHRDAIIADYKAGKIQVVTNAELFTEGLDLPNVDCVVMLRPTRSLSLYLQFAMRSMNPRPGKRAIIIDHVGNVNRFGLPTDDRNWSLYGNGKTGTTNTRVAEVKSVTVCPKCFATFYRSGDKCPACGAVLTEEKELEVVDDVELKKITQQRLIKIHKIIDDRMNMNIAGKRPSDLQSYEEIQAYGKLNNYKPGWAYYYGKKRGFIQ